MPNTSSQRLVKIWLLACLACVALMVFVGGVTRLTESGLSIVEWKLMSGILPPLTHEGWEAELEAYRATPQYQQINQGMNIADFQKIFWLEWLHRLLGRVTGLVFLLPYLYFLARRQLSPILIRRGLIAGLLVASQGFVGWIMVKSGLVDDPRVSPVKLAMHLSLAFIVFAYTLWTYWQVINAPRAPVRYRNPCKRSSASQFVIPAKAGIQSFHRFWIPAFAGMTRTSGFCRVSCSMAIAIRLLTCLIFIQIILGAIVAGLDAGLSYNSWPLMDGDFIPRGLMLLEPWHRNLLENITMVQFQHRMGAYVVTAAAGVFIVLCWPLAAPKLKRWLTALGITLLLQMTLGIFTLLHVVPIGLASAHQMAALLLLALSVRLCYTIPLSKSWPQTQ